MVKTVTINAGIPANRELRITLPADVPIGSAAIVITVSPSGNSAAATFNDLLNSEFFGMWRDRTDIGPSFEYARKLRAESWSDRPQEPNGRAGEQPARIGLLR
jgi:hypothetical protein